MVFAKGFTAIMHIHTAVVEVTVARMLALLDKRDMSILVTDPQFAMEKQLIEVELEAEFPIALELFCAHRQLGRFVLRDDKSTIAFGKVVAVGEKH